jgi:thymidine kinase
VLVLTADIDNRYATNAIVNHDMTSIPARAVPVHGGLMEVLSWPAFREATAVVVEEAQFFVDCLIPFVRAAVDGGKHVVVVGLDSDAEQRPFGDVLALMAHADSIEKKTALCLQCGDGTAAIFTRRLRGGGGDQVEVGGADLYEPVCRRHFTV